MKPTDQHSQKRHQAHLKLTDDAVEAQDVAVQDSAVQDMASRLASDRASLSPSDRAMAELLDQALSPEAVLASLARDVDVDTDADDDAGSRAQGDAIGSSTRGGAVFDPDALAQRIFEQTRDQLPRRHADDGVVGRIGPAGAVSLGTVFSSLGSIAAVLMIGLIGWGHLAPLTGDLAPAWRIASLQALVSPSEIDTPEAVPAVPADLVQLEQLAIKVSEPDDSASSVDRDMAELAFEVEAALTRHETMDLVASLDHELATLDLLLATRLGPVF